MRRSLLASANEGSESSFNYEDYMTIEAISDADVYFEYFESPVETNLEGTKWVETPSQVHIPSGKRLSVRRITQQGETFRTGLMLRLQAEQASGKENTTLWYGTQQYELPISQAMQILCSSTLL